MTLSDKFDRYKIALTDFPTTAFLALMSGFLFAFTGLVMGILTVTRIVWELAHNGHTYTWDVSYTDLLDMWLNKLLLLTGISAGTLIGKRATAKADVIHAETAATVATGQPKGESNAQT